MKHLGSFRLPERIDVMLLHEDGTIECLRKNGEPIGAQTIVRPDAHHRQRTFVFVATLDSDAGPGPWVYREVIR